MAEAGTVGQLLAGEGVQLAVINACRAGSGGGGAASVAGALVRADIPAVVAMQGALTDEAAAAFAAAFYGAIAAGQPLDRAVTSARKAILALGGAAAADWWLPALFMRSPDGLLWQPAESATTAQPAMTATASGSSALAQGAGTKAVAPRGTLVEGDVQGDLIIEGDGKQVVNAQVYIENQTVLAPAGPDPAALRLCYLNHVFESTRQLALAGIDPKAASEAEARLSLGAVYTALDDLDRRKPTSVAWLGASAGSEVAAPFGAGAARPASAAGAAGRPRQRQDHLRQFRGAVPGRGGAGPTRRQPQGAYRAAAAERRQRGQTGRDSPSRSPGATVRCSLCG